MPSSLSSVQSLIVVVPWYILPFYPIISEVRLRQEVVNNPLACQDAFRDDRMGTWRVHVHQRRLHVPRLSDDDNGSCRSPLPPPPPPPLTLSLSKFIAVWRRPRSDPPRSTIDTSSAYSYARLRPCTHVSLPPLPRATAEEWIVRDGAGSGGGEGRAVPPSSSLSSGPCPHRRRRQRRFGNCLPRPRSRPHRRRRRRRSGDRCPLFCFFHF